MERGWKTLKTIKYVVEDMPASSLYSPPLKSILKMLLLFALKTSRKDKRDKKTNKDVLNRSNSSATTNLETNLMCLSLTPGFKTYFLSLLLKL